MHRFAKWVAASTAAAAFVLLAACGQKGPLVIPGVPKDTPWPVTPAPAPAPAPVSTPAPAPAAPAEARPGGGTR